MAPGSLRSRAYHAQRVWSHAARRADVDHRASCRGTSVYWVINSQEWFALRWCHVTLYEVGVVRFTSFVEPRPPKTLWPERSATFLDRRLEITLAAAELNERHYARLAEVFSHPDKALDWELLQQITSDTNLWSERAVAAEAAARVARARRPRR